MSGDPLGEPRHLPGIACNWVGAPASPGDPVRGTRHVSLATWQHCAELCSPPHGPYGARHHARLRAWRCVTRPASPSCVTWNSLALCLASSLHPPARAVVARTSATQRATSFAAAPLAAKRSVAGPALRTAPVREQRRSPLLCGAYNGSRSNTIRRRGVAATTPSTHGTAVSPLVALAAQQPPAVGGAPVLQRVLRHHQAC